MAPLPRLWIYARTSGDEKDTGQDVEAQGAMQVVMAKQRGYEVVGASADDGVSGSVPPIERPGWQEALQAFLADQVDAICILEPSRFSRQEPEVALAAFCRLTEELGVAIVCLTDDTFTTLGKALGNRTLRLVRYVSLWKSWDELMTTRERTQRTMTEIKLGNRATKSGKPTGRPAVAIDPAHLEVARGVLESDGLASAHRKVLELRGHDSAKDPETKKKRFLSRASLARALGVWPAHNSNPLKTLSDQEGDLPDANGAVVSDATAPQTEATA